MIRQEANKRHVRSSQEFALRFTLRFAPPAFCTAFCGAFCTAHPESWNAPHSLL